MRLVLHSVTLRIIVVGVLMGLAGLLPPVLGQTNLDTEALPTQNIHNISPLAQALRWILWFLGGTVLLVAAVLAFLRYRLATSADKPIEDEQWKVDAEEDAGERVEASDVIQACEVLEKTGETEEAPAAEPEPNHSPQTRLFTPASGPAWNESMLKAFLSTCMKVNCLGQTWRESAARRVQASNLPDPREAELTRRLMQRWQEFHVDPESGVFLEHASPEGKMRVCVIRVSKEKRTLIEAAFNAGFVIESVGRYLKSTDLVYRRELGDYHAPTREDLTKMTPGEKQSLIKLTEIRDPWQSMIT